MEGNEGVGHGGHGDEGEEPSGDLTDLVAEVEEADGEAAEDDGEVEPGEEGALVGEEDFGLDARGERDALACGRLLEREREGARGGSRYPGRFGGEAGKTWRGELAGCCSCGFWRRRWSD